jgi:hypothetical protein
MPQKEAGFATKADRRGDGRSKGVKFDPKSNALRRVFEGVVGDMHRGWACGEAFSIVASLIKADVDKKKRVSGDQPTAWPKSEGASQAVRKYLAALNATRSEDESGMAVGRTAATVGASCPSRLSPWCLSVQKKFAPSRSHP